MTTMTWRGMIGIEPAINDLLKEAKSYRAQAAADENFCANAVWYGYHGRGLKERLEQLVGWSARDQRLATSEAYDIAYNKIYNALPDCRHSGMC